jgi:spore germination protein KB
MAANITLGLSSFFSITMMVETKQYIFHFLILLSAALTAHAGFEVMARMFTLMLVFTYFTIAVILLFLLPMYDPWMLLPQLNEGIKPILYGAYISYGFPYSEIYVFAPLMCFVQPNQKEPLGRFMIYASVINVATMIAVSVCAFMVMGETAGTRKFVLYSMARLLELPGIVERVESIAGITLIAGSFIKTTIAIFSLSVTFSRLFKFNNTRLVIFPLTGLIFFLSMTMFPNEAEAVETWNVLWPLISSICAIPIVIAVIVSLVRSPSGKKPGTRNE